MWDPVRGHWDVEHPDNSHTNVKPNGDVEHGDDNFMVGVSAEEWYDFLDEQRWLNGGQYTLYHNILVYPNGEGEVFIPKAPVVTQGLDLSFHLDISCDQTCMDNFYTGGTVALGGLLLVCVFFCIPTPWPVL